MVYLVLVLSLFGETMTTTFTPFYGMDVCEKAKASIIQGIKESPGASPSIKLAQCIRSN